jgi:hypothetical protein
MLPDPADHRRLNCRPLQAAGIAAGAAGLRLRPGRPRGWRARLRRRPPARRGVRPPGPRSLGPQGPAATAAIRCPTAPPWAARPAAGAWPRACRGGLRRPRRPLRRAGLVAAALAGPCRGGGARRRPAAWQAAGGALGRGRRATLPLPQPPYPQRRPAMPTIDADTLQAALGRARCWTPARPSASAARSNRWTRWPATSRAPNRFFKDNLGPDGRFKPAASCAPSSRPCWPAAALVVHQCGSGVTACHNLLAMAHAGLGPARSGAPCTSASSSPPTAPTSPPRPADGRVAGQADGRRAARAGVKEPFPYSAISEMQPVPPQEFFDAQERIAAAREGASWTPPPPPACAARATRSRPCTPGRPSSTTPRRRPAT